MNNKKELIKKEWKFIIAVTLGIILLVVLMHFSIGDSLISHLDTATGLISFIISACTFIVVRGLRSKRFSYKPSTISSNDAVLFISRKGNEENNKGNGSEVSILFKDKNIEKILGYDENEGFAFDTHKETIHGNYIVSILSDPETGKKGKGVHIITPQHINPVGANDNEWSEDITDFISSLETAAKILAGKNIHLIIAGPVFLGYIAGDFFKNHGSVYLYHKTGNEYLKVGHFENGPDIDNNQMGL